METEQVNEIENKVNIEGNVVPQISKRKLSEEHKKKLSETRKRLFTEGKLIPTWKGKHISEEHKKSISKANKGKEFSEEHKYNISMARIEGFKSGRIIHPALRKPKSEEAKLKMGETRKRLFKEGKMVSWNKGKKEVELYGIEKAKELNEARSKRMKGKNYEEMYGDEEAKNMKVRIAEQMTGKNNNMYGKVGPLSPGWKGGISFEPYTPDFNTQFKNLIRQRDNQICLNCNKHREKLNRALAVHHINYIKELTIPENCISLCTSCHSLTNNNREYWQKLCQEKLSKLYGYKYDEKGKIIINLNNQLNEKEVNK